MSAQLSARVSGLIPDRKDMHERIIDVANAIRSDRYKDADAIFAAGFDQS